MKLTVNLSTIGGANVKKNSQNDIEEVFKKLGLSEADYPDYDNPHDFAQRFEKCSILKDHFITQTDSSMTEE